MLSSISLKAFKAYEEVQFNLRPLTFFLGPNNSGKSSLLSPLRLLAQTVKSADPRVPLLLDGPMGDFGTYRDVVHGNSKRQTITIGVSGTGDPGIFWRRRKNEQVTWDISLEYKYRPRRRQLVMINAEISDKDGHLVTVSHVDATDRYVLSKLMGTTVGREFRSGSEKAIRLMNFLPNIYLPMGLSRSGTKGETINVYGIDFDTDELHELDSRIDSSAWTARAAFESLDYIGAMRMPPQRTYHQTGEARSSIGANGENWTGILVLDSSLPRSKRSGVMQEVQAWLRNAGLASDLAFNWLSDRHYEVQIEHPVTGELENLADVGQATSQVLPVLVGGLNQKGGATYIVEEPEIHLHPKAQAALGDYFLTLAKRGVNCAVETHSEYLVLRLQQLVAAGMIDPQQVGFYYVWPNPETMRKDLRELSLTEDGRFEGEWEGGFFPERMEEARTLSRIRMQGGMK